MECNKENYKDIYIGETSRYFKERVKEHIGYIKALFPTQTTGKHFNLPGYCIRNMTKTILEQFLNNS